MENRGRIGHAGVSFVAGCALIGILAGPATAQSPTVRAVAPAYKAQLDALTPQLRSLEQNFNSLTGRLTSAKVITPGDMQNADLEKALENYANAMKSAYDAAVKDAETAGKTKGASGNVAHLKEFEDLAKSHSATVNRLKAQGDQIQSQIKSGAIKLDRAVLERATPPQRIEFQRFLQAPARNELLKQHKDLFQRRSGTLDALRLADLGDRATFWDWLADREEWSVNACMTSIGNLLISPAEAAIAAPCVGGCLSMQWSACAACIVSKGPQAIAAWNSFVRCWNHPTWSGCYCPWWMPNFVCRIGFVAVLVAKLA